jgi:hypothetical protein
MAPIMTSTRPEGELLFSGRPALCYERRESAVDAFVDVADASITTRSLSRRAWTGHRRDTRPRRRR